MPVPEPASDWTLKQPRRQAGWLLAERYRVLDRIGSGGMAEVFRARDELLARDVAVKVFRRELDPATVPAARSGRRSSCRCWPSSATRT